MTGLMILLDQLAGNARIAAIDRAALGESEANRLKQFGFDEGVSIEPLHLGPFGRPAGGQGRPDDRRHSQGAGQGGQSHDRGRMNSLPLVAVAGNPNAGKSALFNALTGARQKVGNYPGVTVERHVGRATLPDGAPNEFVDLPGAYGPDPSSPDEAVTRDVLLGKQKGERLPQALLIVVDASNLDNHPRFACS
jgi:hypothetical protein